jgi:hypothetical protein
MSAALGAVVENEAAADAPIHGPAITIDPAPPMVQELLLEFVRISENATLKPPRGATGPVAAVNTCESQGSAEVEAVVNSFDLAWLLAWEVDVTSFLADVRPIPLTL